MDDGHLLEHLVNIGLAEHQVNGARVFATVCKMVSWASLDLTAHARNSHRVEDTLLQTTPFQQLAQDLSPVKEHG